MGSDWERVEITGVTNENLGQKEEAGGWPIQAVLWLEWGSSTAGRSFPWRVELPSLMGLSKPRNRSEGPHPSRTLRRVGSTLIAGGWRTLPSWFCSNHITDLRVPHPSRTLRRVGGSLIAAPEGVGFTLR
jgi:hypothetical protein